TRGRNLRWLRTAADALEHRRLTPAILFFPSRRECDDAARMLGAQPAPDEARRAEKLREWILQVPELTHHPLLPALQRGGVAPHPVISAFTPSDAQVLNLLARASIRDAEAILKRSFAAFQRRPQIAPVRERLLALPSDPLTSRPCGDRLATRSRFDHLVRHLRQSRHKKAGGPAASAGDAV